MFFTQASPENVKVGDSVSSNINPKFIQYGTVKEIDNTRREYPVLVAWEHPLNLETEWTDYEFFLVEIGGG